MIKKIILAGLLAFAVPAIHAAEPRDLADLERVHTHIQEAIKEMEAARAANHYDMQGHGSKVEQLLKQAGTELRYSMEAARKEAPKK